MARTKADAAKKAGGKAPSKARVLRVESSCSSSTKSKGDKYSGGNTYCPRPTPEWQEPITNFFDKKQSEETNGQDEEADMGEGASSSLYVDLFISGPSDKITVTNGTSYEAVSEYSDVEASGEDNEQEDDPDDDQPTSTNEIPSSSDEVSNSEKVSNEQIEDDDDDSNSEQPSTSEQNPTSSGNIKKRKRESSDEEDEDEEEVQSTSEEVSSATDENNPKRSAE